jgi:predicted metalloprotease with PDZ domain
MSKRHRIVAVAALLFFARPAFATIDYSVSVAHPEHHVFGVTIHVPDVHDRVVLQMPAWNALYQIRDFASHVMQVSAQDNAGNPLAIRKLDKETWQVTGNGSLTVAYSIFWDEPGPFTSQLNAEHAFINPAMILLYVPDRRAEDTRISFSDLPQKWRSAVELNPADDVVGSRANVFTAPSYDALVDAPVELGIFDELHFEAGGRPIRVAIHGDAGDRTRLTDALKRIVNYQVSLMGGAPFREYLFVFHVGLNFGGGGMEHANSTAISADLAAQLPSYSAHEFFHAWNVKRIRPQSLEPVDFTKEMSTRALWFAEGVTNTYGCYTLVRTGLWSSQQFYGNLADQITELESRPAHRWQSAEQSGLDAWFEKYSLYLRPEESISYYNKGQLLGVMLDIIIRYRTENRASLDDVLRALNLQFAQQGRFYNESSDLRAVAEDVIRKKAPQASADLTEFFANYVAGTKEIPFEDILGRAGLVIKDTAQRRAAFGFPIVWKTGESPSIGELTQDGDAQRSGLREGDVIAALNGENFPRVPERWLREHQPEERVKLKVRRNREELDLSVPLGRQSDAVYRIEEMPQASRAQREIRNGILHGAVSPSR